MTKIKTIDRSRCQSGTNFHNGQISLDEKNEKEERATRIIAPNSRRRWIESITFTTFTPPPRKKKFGRTRCYKVETVIFFRGRRLFSFSRSSASVLGTRQSHASILRLVISRPTLRRWNRRFSFLSLPFSDRNCSLFSKDQITQSFGCIQRNVTREHVFKKSEVFEGFEYALVGLNK